MQSLPPTNPRSDSGPEHGCTCARQCQWMSCSPRTPSDKDKWLSKTLTSLPTSLQWPARWWSTLSQLLVRFVLHPSVLPSKSSWNANAHCLTSCWMNETALMVPLLEPPDLESKKWVVKEANSCTYPSDNSPSMWTVPVGLEMATVSSVVKLADRVVKDSPLIPWVQDRDPSVAMMLHVKYMSPRQTRLTNFHMWRSDGLASHGPTDRQITEDCGISLS